LIDQAASDQKRICGQALITSAHADPVLAAGFVALAGSARAGTAEQWREEFNEVARRLQSRCSSRFLGGVPLSWKGWAPSEIASATHGKGKVAVKPAPRHAELAVNLAGALAIYLLSTWEARNEPAT
jgi:hypothetical protein